MLSQWFLLSLSLLLLLSCTKGGSYAPNDPYKLPKRIRGTADADVINMLNQFRKHGITVVSMGQDHVISIPSKFLFADQSPRITWPGYLILNEVACYLRQFRKISVHITSYTGKYMSVAREQALTLTRSRAVADYLWTQSIKTRFIFTEGAGSEKPITPSQKMGDCSPNSRVEITFRDTII